MIWYDIIWYCMIYFFRTESFFPSSNHYIYPPPCRRPHWRDFGCRELHPQLQFYEFPGWVSSLSSTRFQVEPPASRWSFRLTCWCFLKGGMEIHCGYLRLLAWVAPPLWRPFSLSCLILALLGAILDHLGALRPHLVAKLLQDGAQMAQHSPT